MIMMTRGGSTLTIQGITWACLSFNDCIAFGYGKHAIHYVPETQLYHIKESGETIFVAQSVTECLEVAAEMVWEYHARQLSASWAS
jgi:hypothetical protein